MTNYKTGSTKPIYSLSIVTYISRYYIIANDIPTLILVY